MNIPMLMVRMDESNSPLAFVVRLRYQDSQRITLQTWNYHKLSLPFSEPNTCRNMLKWFAKWLAHQQTCSCNCHLKNFLPLSPISIVYQHQMIGYKEIVKSNVSQEWNVRTVAVSVSIQPRISTLPLACQKIVIPSRTLPDRKRGFLSWWKYVKIHPFISVCISYSSQS